VASTIIFSTAPPIKARDSLNFFRPDRALTYVKGERSWIGACREAVYGSPDCSN
jgi:hypothetical protein